jgi:hypothetical protein
MHPSQLAAVATPLAEMALRTAFCVLRDGQGRQIDVQPEELPHKVVVQATALPTEQGFAAAPELVHARLREDIECAGQGGLIGKAVSSPGVGQSQVWTETRIDVGYGATPGKNTDEHVQQLGDRGVINGFQRQTQVRPY